MNTITNYVSYMEKISFSFDPETIYLNFFTKDFFSVISNKIFSHSHNRFNKHDETLYEHSDRIIRIFCKIIMELNIDDILFELLSKLYNKTTIEEQLNNVISKTFFIQFFEKTIYRIILLHDIGKINPNFQYEKMDNSIDLSELKINEKLFTDSKHSKYAKYFLNLILTNELEKTEFYKNYKTIENQFEKEMNTKVLYLLAYIGLILNSIVERHHSNLVNLDGLLEYQKEEYVKRKDIIKKIEENIMLFTNDLYITNFFQLSEFENIKKQLEEDYTLFFIYKLIFSLLIVSDYYATYAYYEGVSPEEIRINHINKGIFDQINYNFYRCKKYNQNLKCEDKIKYIKDIKIEDIDDINILRTKILLEASNNLNHYLNEGNNRIFFLNVPTGGGKTNISMKLFLDIFHHSNVKNIKKAHYIFPYINIIEQNHNAIVETFGLKHKEIISKIYSYNEWDFTKNIDEEEYFINQQFLNYPINIISNVNYFNSFIKNTKKSNYKVLNFVNSIIILDEIQTLPIKNWEYFSTLLKETSENYNNYFILMSATLPDLSKFIDDKTIFKNLIDNPQKYHKHRCFSRNNPIIEVERDINIENPRYFIEHILNERKNQSENFLKILCVVNTVQTSYDIYTYLKEKLPDEYGVFLLNSTILSQRKQKIIKIFNTKPVNLKQNVILISTQSVEAGVNIDCHFGFREYSPIDSIEQIGGRINRENKRSQRTSKLFVFNLGTYKRVYNKDIRIIIQDQCRTMIKGILKSKRFNEFYDQVINYLMSEECKNARIFNEFKKPTFNLDFEQLSRYNYIDTYNMTLFVPLKINLTEYPFNENEINYLLRNNISISNQINGEEIWELFKLIRSNKYQKNKIIETKKIQSILNKFSFSIYNRTINKNTLHDLFEFFISTGKFEEIGGLIKIDNNTISELQYTINSGLNPKNLAKLDAQLTETCII